MGPCEFLNQCAFYAKYGGKTSRTWTEIFTSYCRGDLFAHCRRWKAYRNQEEEPGVDVMPGGGIVPEGFTRLP